MKIKNRHTPDTSKHLQEQKFDAGRRHAYHSAKTDKVRRVLGQTSEDRSQR
jgi:hypothetical protein